MRVNTGWTELCKCRLCFLGKNAENAWQQGDQYFLELLLHLRLSQVKISFSNSLGKGAKNCGHKNWKVFIFLFDTNKNLNVCLLNSLPWYPPLQCLKWYFQANKNFLLIFDVLKRPLTVNSLQSQNQERSTIVKNDYRWESGKAPIESSQISHVAVMYKLVDRDEVSCQLLIQGRVNT